MTLLVILSLVPSFALIFHRFVVLIFNVFTPRDVVRGVLATATCLSVCPYVRPSVTADIVSKGLNPS